jgi:hypothetical protein
MKKFYTLIGIAVLSFSAQAQVVNIPDVNFKNALLNHIPVIDTNNDNEIETGEAMAVTVLHVYQKNISSLAGIEAFTNLVDLDCGANNLSALDVTPLTNLQRLFCPINQLISLNVTGLQNLAELTCSQNNFATLALSGLPNLTFLECSNNHFAALDLSNVPSLKRVFCAYNDLTFLNVNGLSNVEELYCYANDLNTLNFAALTGVKELNFSYNLFTGAFNASVMPNIETLNFERNDISSATLTGLNHLRRLTLTENNISAIDLSGLTALEILESDQNSLTSLDVTGLASLKQISANYNHIAALSIADLPHFQSLGIIQNGLSSLTLQNLNELILIQASNNNLQSIDLSTLPGLLTIYLNNNPLQAIDVSANPNLYSLQCYDNPQLSYLNIKNGHAIQSLNFEGCILLQYICVDNANIQSTLAIAQNFGLSGIQVNTYCDFTPGGTFNTISGTATIDSDNNGCDTNDDAVPGIKINLSNGTNIGAAILNTSGAYAFFTQQGSFTLTPQFENPYFSCSPTSATVNFSTVDGSVQPQNFCITPLGTHNDLEITIIPLTALRPGFDANFQLVYKNKGTHTVPSGSVSLSFADAVLDLVTAAPMPDSQAADIMNWNYTNLNPFETRTINLTVNLNGPTETPPANIDDVIHFLAVINPTTGDEIIRDNTFELTQTVVGSFDPNDKTCLNGTYIDPEMIGDFLHYLIRFQNTGTAPAENIVIKDAIDLSKFDISTFQMVTASHPYETHIESEHVEFIFNGIQLPGGVNNPLSHGFVTFKIKTKVNLPVGSSVSNKADIFFDYNFPITTKKVTYQLSQLGTIEIDDHTISVYQKKLKKPQ